MNKKILPFVVSALIVIFAVGCNHVKKTSGNNPKDDKKSIGTELIVEQSENDDGESLSDEKVESEQSMDVVSMGDSQGDVLFAELSQYSFSCTSVGGTWSSKFSINPDGSFCGLYYDVEKEDKGKEYPNGTTYISEYYGQFSEFEKNEENVYKMKIDSLEYVDNDTSFICNSMKYKMTDAVGFEKTKEFCVNGPKLSKAECSKEFVQSLKQSKVSIGDTLNTYYIFNEKAGKVFQGTKMKKNALKNMKNIYKAELAARNMSKGMEKQKTKLEKNSRAGELFRMWDDVLNDEWKLMKSLFDEKTMNILLKTELQWIDQKEYRIKQINKSSNSGSELRLAENQKAADITRIWVYELARSDAWNKVK